MPNLIKVAVLIQHQNSFLLIQENSPRVRGLWNMPQGTVENGEDLEAAAVREVYEETGFTIRIERKIQTLTNTFPDTKELHVYKGIILKGNPRFPTDEIQDVQFFTREQIDTIKQQLVGDWVYEIVMKQAT